MKAPESPGISYLLEPVAPPIIWISYFMVVYLIAEAACAMEVLASGLLGLQGVSVITIVATIATIGAISFFTLRSWKRFRRADRESAHATLGLIGVLSGAFFIVASIYVGVPALVMAPC